MKFIAEHYLFYVLVLVGAGIGLEYLATQEPLHSELIKRFDETGSVTSSAIISQTAKGAILSILAVFVFSLAISIFITVFVSKRLEENLLEKKEDELRLLQQAINADVFDSLFKKIIPEEIFTAIKADVIGNKIVRKNANWIYDFTILKDGTTIQLIQTIKYELHNVSQTSLGDAINSTFDIHNQGGLHRIQCRLDGKEILDEVINQNNYSNVEVGASILLASGKVEIQRDSEKVFSILATVDIPPGRHIDVTQVYNTNYKNNYVNDGYFTKYPLINATLVASFPEEYEFTVFPSLSTPIQETLNEPGRSIHELHGGVLPKQGLVYTLSKKIP